MQLSLVDMFKRQDSVYWNTYGVNIRAVAAFALGIIPTLPGFIRNVSRTSCTFATQIANGLKHLLTGQPKPWHSHWCILRIRRNMARYTFLLYSCSLTLLMV